MPVIHHEPRVRAATGAGDPAPPLTGVPLHRIVLGSGLGIAGITLVVTGTFLPWVDSAGVLRNSYAVAGLLQRLDLIDSAGIRMLLAAWAFVGPLCLVPVVLAILRWWRSAGVAATVVGLLVGAVAAVVMVYTAGKEFAGVHLAGTGPWTVVAGAATLIAAGLLLAMPSRRVDSPW